MKNIFQRANILVVFVLLTSCRQNQEQVDTDLPVYMNYNKPIEERVADLVGQMTLEEKVSQLMFNSSAIPRLNIPEYNWWNECLHGVARAGNATVFPQAIGMAATFDDDLIYRVASAISDEARAKFNIFISRDIRDRYSGLTFWTPNINIFRDPRWGRGQETYGEDPYLTGRIGSAFVRGLQGDHPKYLKVAACAKHYVVHSGPERDRHVFNAKATKKDMFETYLPAFKSLVDAGVEAIMCAYNRTNGEPCCGSEYLLQNILREQWNFKGHIVSDCWALEDFHDGHKVTSNAVESAALALKSGVNLNCGNVLDPNLLIALDQGLIDENLIETRLSTLLKTRFKLGLFDPLDKNPYNSISQDVIRCEKHKNLAREAAQKSIVLLKNRDNLLPLSDSLKKIYIVGPNASSTEVLLGNYYGTSDEMVSILEGISGRVGSNSLLHYKQGILADRENVNPIDWSTGEAGKSDVVIAVIGISNQLEGEEGESIASPYYGDRFNIGLPKNQVNYLRKIRSQSNTPIIAVITGGSPMAIFELDTIVDAILYVWYPGEQGGNAVADIIFGDISPSGKLPISFPKSLDQLPPYNNYSMKGRTYRYFKDKPLYPFGYGMSYSRFTYDELNLNSYEISLQDSLQLSVDITNIGNINAEEVVQLYLTDLKASCRVPLYSLIGFKRIYLKAGESKKVNFNINIEKCKLVNENGERILEPGKFKLTIGGASPGKRSKELGVEFVEEHFEIKI